MTCRSKYLVFSPGGPILHNMAKTFDGPPTLERSGSEHRVGRLHPSFLRREGLVRMWSSPCRRDGEVEKSLYQQGRTGWFACKAILTIMWCNQNEYNEQRGTTKDRLFPFVRLEAIVSGVSVIITKVATKRKMEKPPRKSISIPSKAQK